MKYGLMQGRLVDSGGNERYGFENSNVVEWARLNEDMMVC